MENLCRLLVRYFLPDFLTKFGVPRQICVEFPNVSFTEICPVDVALMQADGRSDGHDECNRRSSRVRVCQCIRAVLGSTGITYREYIVSVKRDKNNGYFTGRLMYSYDSISPNSSLNEKDFEQTL